MSQDMIGFERLTRLIERARVKPPNSLRLQPVRFTARPRARMPFVPTRRFVRQLRDWVDRRLP